MPGIRSKPLPSGKFQGWFTNYKGKQQFFTGTRNKTETKRIASAKEDEHRQIRLGYRPEPKSTEHLHLRPFLDVCADYLAWGSKQGGRGGRPWSEKHSHNRKVQLIWWRDQLDLDTLNDLADGLLNRVEVKLRELSERRTNKTAANYSESLAAFCDWCVQRDFLATDPLKNIVGFDTTPVSRRRTMESKEIKQILSTSAPDKCILYETALLTGLRKNELRNLTRGHLDLERIGLHLDATWTKNRKAGFQPISQDLAQRLADFADSGEPLRLYKLHFSRNAQAQSSRIPSTPLLYVPSHPARSLDQDLKRCGISKVTPKGKLDFHSARVAYINLLLEDNQISRIDVQELARHSTLKLTLDVYGRAQDERMGGAIERMALKIAPEAPIKENHALFMYGEELEAERKIATPLNIESCDSSFLAPEVGLEPTTK